MTWKILSTILDDVSHINLHFHAMEELIILLTHSGSHSPVSFITISCYFTADLGEEG